MESENAVRAATPKRTVVWQWSLITLAVFGLVQLISSMVSAQLIDGYTGINSDYVKPFIYRVTSVDPDTPATRAGILAGDRIDTRDMSRSDRLRFFSFFIERQTYALKIRRGSVTRTSVLVVDRNVVDFPEWVSIRWHYYFRVVGLACMLLVAAFLSWRRPQDPKVRLFSLALSLIALGVDFSEGAAWSVPSATLQYLGYLIGPIMGNAGLVMLASYAMLFARPPSKLRLGLTIAAYAGGAFVAYTAVYQVIGMWYGTLDPNDWFLGSSALYPLRVVLNRVLPFICALLAVRASRGSERSRIAWATGALSILYAAPFVDIVFPDVGIGFGDTIGFLVYNLSFFVAPIGLAYALLGHRLLDVGFALNRAAVFTAMSLVIVALFSLGEWSLGGWLHAASKSTNMLVSAGLALALGLSIHPIHGYVDRVVDTVFFHKRHRAETAIRMLAKEVAYITDPGVIVARATDLLLRVTDCTFARVALYDGFAKYGDVDENDAALVALRCSHDLVHLRNVPTALAGEYAFPMSTRGRVIGALVVGPKRLDESYAPDERSAIEALARAMGVAIDVLTLERERRVDAVLESNRAVIAALERLPDAIAARLRDASPYVRSE